MATDKQKWCLEKVQAKIESTKGWGSSLHPYFNALIGEIERHKRTVYGHCEWCDNFDYGEMDEAPQPKPNCTPLKEIAQKLGWKE